MMSLNQLLLQPVLLAFHFRTFLGRPSLLVFTFFVNLTWWEEVSHAQLAQGWVNGQVREVRSAQGLRDVRVSITSADGNGSIAVSTDGFGQYRFLALPPDHYELTFQKPDYLTVRVNQVRVQSSRVSSVNIEMRKGPAYERATVSDWQADPANTWGLAHGSVFSRWSLFNLPSARNIWALLEHQEPSSITNRVDEGGVATGTIALIGVHGSSWTQNAYRFDGVNVTDPFDTGKPLVYPDFGSIQEFQVSTAIHLAAANAPGASFSVASRPSQRKLHGGAEGYYLGEPLQSSNLDDRLRQFGFTTVPHFKRFGEGQFTLGGALPRTTNWSFFTSLGIQHLSKIIPEFPAIPSTTVYSGFFRFDRRLAGRHELNLVATGQSLHNSHLGARPGIAPSAALRGYDRFEVLHGHWAHRRHSETVWQLRGGFSHTSPTDTFLRGTTEPNRTQLFTGEMTGAAPVEADSARSRFSLMGQAQLWRQTLAGRMQHLIDLGIDLEESLATEDRRVFKDVQLLFFPSSVPVQVIQYNTPSRTKYRLREYSVFFDDQLQMGRRWFVHFGLTWDASRTFLPAQRTGAGTFAPERRLAGVSKVISWKTLGPRVGLAVPVFQRFGGGTRLSAHFARYYHLLPARYGGYANPNSLGGQVYSWNDRNQDRSFQPGEDSQLLRVFGGPYSAVDAQLQRPFTDEWGLALDQQFGRRVQASVRLFRRDDKRLVETVNEGVPSSAFRPVQLFDAGDDNLPATRDDQVLTVYEQNPATLGQDRFLLTNPPGFRSLFEGLEIGLRQELGERWFLSLSWSAHKVVGPSSPGNSEFENDSGVIGSLFDDPNSGINARGRLYFDRAYVGKAAVHCRVPGGWQLGSVVKYLDGLPFGRKLIVTGLSQGPFFVMATPRGQPGGLRTQFSLTFDQRISREVEFGRVKLALLIDIFNLLNLNRNLREFDISGPWFPARRPLEVQNPRAIRLGVRWSF